MNYTPAKLCDPQTWDRPPDGDRASRDQACQPSAAKRINAPRTHRTKILWIAWQEHRRSRSLARILGAELNELAATLGRPRVVRYLLNVEETVRILTRRRPDIVICQHPSFVLAGLTVLLRPFLGFRLGFDAHNGGLAIEAESPRLLYWLATWLQRRADFVIVHNDAVEALVKKRGGTVIALPDPLPEIAPVAPAALSHAFSLLFISTFSFDEPHLAVLEAARRIDPDIGIYVTGDFRGKVDPAAWPENVVFCGRVPWERYDQLLRSVNGVIDLTTRERCLVCGAYEAVAAGKPMILSRTATLMAYFRQGAVFTDNHPIDSPHSIRRSILELREREVELKTQVAVLKEELIRDSNARLGRLQALL